MEQQLLPMLLALVAGSVGSVALAALLLLLRPVKLQQVSGYLSDLAGGTLLGAAFLGMMPKAISMMPSATVMLVVLGGLVFFFVLEKLILWRSCGNKNCERHLQAAAPMILIGDAFHNAIDGIIIAASFLTSPEMGVFVTLSVIVHEIPQELGDFGILIQSGMSKNKSLLYNALSGSTAILSGVIAYFFMQNMQGFIPYALAFSAASFMYIALAELIPVMHSKTSAGESIRQVLLILVGILIIFLIKH
ncbi:MAG: ZIP family metal transporter [Paludibacter sp.]|nr:ZIP family metal transporter [Paludibacter sp.]